MNSPNLFNPKTNLLDGIRAAFPRQMFPWDDYFARMAETDFLSGRANITAVKSFFIRQAPFGGSYALLGGITDALRNIKELNFKNKDFEMGMFDMDYCKDFIEWLKYSGRLNIQVFAPPEGTAFFPNEPVVSVRGPLAHVRLVEGILTESINFATLCLTKWHRLVRVVRPGNVLEFGRRRSQNHMRSALCGLLAGCFATSNSEVRRFFDVKVVGTMGHEWVQGFGDVQEAFKIWLEHQPNRPIGLIDTKQCLEYDFPIWLNQVYNHRELIKDVNSPIWGWRNDSGDLAYLTIEQYARFLRHDLAKDDWFRHRMNIFLTNELDEYSAQSIIQQIRAQAGEAGFDAEDILRRIIWAAGTKPSTCEDQSSLGGVAKLVEIGGKACIKLAFDSEGRPGVKTSIPGFNSSALIRGEDGEIKCLLIFPSNKYSVLENKLFSIERGAVSTLITCHPDNPNARMEIRNYTAEESRQKLVYDSCSYQAPLRDEPTIEHVTNMAKQSVDQLHWTMTRIDKPYPMKISLTPDLFGLRQNMINQGALRSDFLK